MIRCKIQEFQPKGKLFVLRFNKSDCQSAFHVVIPTSVLVENECRVLFRYDVRRKTYVWHALLVSDEFYKEYFLKEVVYHA